jgi:hypothetical protein
MYRTACVCLVCTGSARVPRVSTESVCTHRSLLCHAHGNTSCTTPGHFFSCSECRRSARVLPRSSVSSLIIPNGWPKLHSTSTCGRGLLFPHWSQLQVATHFSKLNCLLASTLNLPLPQPSLPWKVEKGIQGGIPFYQPPPTWGRSASSSGCSSPSRPLLSFFSTIAWTAPCPLLHQPLFLPVLSTSHPTLPAQSFPASN